MLYWLGSVLDGLWGPFRLLSSHLLLIASGLVSGFVLSLVLLPRLSRFLPRDRGREFAHDGEAARGKPTGAGVFFITIFFVLSLLVVPISFERVAILLLTMLVMASGYLDDRSHRPWHEYLKGAVDLGVALLASLVLIAGGVEEIWLPFTKATFQPAPIVSILVSTIVIWISINTTNCSDGVDGLSSTLVLLALLSLGAFLYFVVGHGQISGYFLVPHYPDAAGWAIMIFVLVGSLSGYLWHNAHPSSILMGDAGSRALGFFIGIAVIKTGNPVLILIVSTVLLVNGGVGLVKLALLRFFRIRVLHDIRFPLHDHFRHSKGWSNTQVLVRFALVQLMLGILLFGLVLKVR
jgi:phospho-N-acetylmuramoyl-pentapeptide-transferase